MVLPTLIALLVATVTIPTVSAQDVFAFLQRQPQVATGVPLFPANTVRYAWSVYRYADREIEVYVVPTVAAPPGAPEAREALEAGDEVWEPRVCPGFDLSGTTRESVGSGERDVLLRVARERYTLYLTTSGRFEEACFFVASFVEIFEFFLDESPRRIETLRPPPEFPAVLETRG